jgi:hypothetical protein
MRIILFSALMTIAVLVSGCKDQDIAYDMARFDRAYVPALVLTGSKDTTGQSVLAVKRLKQDWAVLSAKHAQVFAIDGAAEKVNSKLDRADMLITTGDFQGAHTELEEIRDVFLDARKRHGIDYFMDYLTEFHSTMEDIVSVAEGKDPSHISDADVSSMARLLPEASARWQALEKAPFDRGSFLFDKQTEKALRDAMAEEARAIDNLDAAIRSGNRKLIKKHALLLKKGYARVFKMFGNFESVSI